MCAQHDGLTHTISSAITDQDILHMQELANIGVSHKVYAFQEPT